MTVGTLCGIHLYKQYAKSKIYHSSIDLPIDHLLHEARTSGSTVDDNLPKNGMIFRKHNYRLPLTLHEEFHIDLESQVYERIFVPRVPEFIRGRRGQFIHDFMQNKTGIVDIDGRRCFVMPLDRTRILPPRNLFDLLMKLKAGYYKVDTKMVQLTMRVVQPPIVNYKSLGYYIAREYVGFPTYKLEKMTSAYADFNQHVYKRSVKEDTNVSNFVEYAGSLIQYRILNIEDAKHTR
ncbi:ITM2B (predicted) [Pycnogonum litorale]